MHLNKQQDFWINVLCTDETKVEMFGHIMHSATFGENQTQNTSINTSLSEKKGTKAVTGAVPFQKTSIQQKCCAGTLRELCVRTQKQTNLNELKKHCKEEWAKIPAQRCERRIKSYKK